MDDPDLSRYAEKVMTANNVAAIGALVYAHPELTDVLAEHLEDNDHEVLSHMVLADIVRWMISHRESHPATCHSILVWLEREAIHGPVGVPGMIRVSGVEALPDPGEPGAELRKLLGPELRSMDPWRDHTDVYCADQ